MVSFLILLAAAVVVLHVLWTRRRGGSDVAVAVIDSVIAVAALVLVVEGSNFLIDYSWWKALGQAETFWQYVQIRWEPQSAAVVLGFIALAAAFRLGRRHSRSPFARTKPFFWIGHAVALCVSFLLAVDLVDPWRVALWLGSRDTGSYRDPIFGHGLAFYMFRLPFYRMIFAWFGSLLVIALILYGLTLAVGASAERFEDLRMEMEMRMRGTWVPTRGTGLRLADFAGLLRVGAVLLLVLYAVSRVFARYDLLYSSHRFLYGADFVDVHVGLPLIWAQIVITLAIAVAIGFRLRRRRRWATPGPWLAMRSLGIEPALVFIFLGVLIVPPIVTASVHAVYVRPNELTLERPYIVDHIAATRSAYGIAHNVKPESFTPRQDSTFDLAKYPDTADNIRLWDLRPFQDNITQLQALRPYYDFPAVDLDRYQLDGEKRQVMIAARNLNTNLLPDSAQTWVNLHLQYTHGYGAVAGLVNEASSGGEPRLILQDAPTVARYPRLRLTRPQIYFGEQTNRWVLGDTQQPEFDYPRGEDNAYNTYHGADGVPVANFGMRLAAAIAENDPNIVLTDYLTPHSKLLLHRQIVRRVQRLAPFLRIDPDPYLVVNRAGRLFWILDGYTVSDRHPYSEPIDLGNEQINYIRNSVKITVDAYSGTVHFYVFDPHDPIIAAYRRVFPHLFLPRSAMPADLLEHIRYPELLFSAQAQILRLYHMVDPRVFYNKEDQWDIANQEVTQGETEQTQPYYVMMQLPGTQHAEFVLMIPFTSHNRDNLIAWMAARCDPAHYGQILLFRLPKDQLIYGPLQIESRVDQNPNISKDLSLWNQQGSRVIRGTTLVLPVGNTFVYVEPIYIQATQAQLPELKKVVLAAGKRIVYADNLTEAMAELAQPAGSAAASSSASSSTPVALPLAPAGNSGIPPAVLKSIQQHLDNYEKFTSEGHLSQAGAELEAIRKETAQALAGSEPAKGKTPPAKKAKP